MKALRNGNLQLSMKIISCQTLPLFINGLVHPQINPTAMNLDAKTNVPKSSVCVITNCNTFAVLHSKHTLERSEHCLQSRGKPWPAKQDLIIIFSSHRLACHGESFCFVFNYLYKFKSWSLFDCWRN